MRVENSGNNRARSVLITFQKFQKLFLEISQAYLLGIFTAIRKGVDRFLRVSYQQAFDTNSKGILRESS